MWTQQIIGQPYATLAVNGQEGHSQIKFKFIANKVPFYDSTGHGWLGDDGPVGNTERAKQSGAKKKGKRSQKIH